MINSCPAPKAFGVVNSYPETFADGFGAGYAASLINQLGTR